MYCYKNGNDCPYRNICKDKTSNGDCHVMCTRFHEIDILFSNANIPRKYLQPYKLYPDDRDCDSYETLDNIKKNIKQLVEEGFNLYLCSSKKLNGKTSWAIKILQNYLHHIKQESGGRKRGLYLKVDDYLRELKSSFDTNDLLMKSFEKDIDEVDLVVWDDIDESKLSEWEKGNIKQHIKRRLANNLSNIFVGKNLDYKLSNIIGEDLKTYIQDNSLNVILFAERGDM